MIEIIYLVTGLLICALLGIGGVILFKQKKQSADLDSFNKNLEALAEQMKDYHTKADEDRGIVSQLLSNMRSAEQNVGRTDNQINEKIKKLEQRIQYLEPEVKRLITETANTNSQATATVITDDQRKEIKANIIETTDENFNEKVLKNKKLVLTDMWATWCAPCLSLAPILQEISEEMKDQVVITKHNIDEHPNQPTKYGVRGLPTMLLFKNGELAGTKVGVTSKSNIVSWIKENI